SSKAHLLGVWHRPLNLGVGASATFTASIGSPPQPLDPLPSLAGGRGRRHPLALIVVKMPALRCQTSFPLVTTRRPSDLRPGAIVAVSAFDSWIETFGSATNETSSFAASPTTRPRL